MYKKPGFLIQLIVCPFRLAGRNWTMFLIPKRFPRYIPQKSTAFRTDIIDLELIGQILQLLRYFSRLTGS